MGKNGRMKEGRKWNSMNIMMKHICARAYGQNNLIEQIENIKI